MEKGNTRNSTASKLNPETQAKSKDAASKNFRLPRVKESISPRSDVRRKSNPQKSRELYDKRPRNRNGAVRERYRSEVTEELDIGQLTKQDCKKMNLNHLLNFTLTPHDNREVIGRRGTFKTKLPRYNKDLFLQANCQFIARDCGNYSVHEKNPDILVEWPLIEEIRFPSHEVPLCPICLYCPIAAKITKCGHIYCWPCILHYLALTDRAWEKCPICFDAVYKNELKSVSVSIRKAFSVGDEIVMCLMKRAKGSLLPFPVAHTRPKHLICNVNNDDSLTRFQKLLLANRKDVECIINRERLELEEAYEQEKDAPEVCFIESALKLLKERETILMNVPTIDKYVAEVDATLHNDNAAHRHHLESVSSTDSHEEIFQIEVSEKSVALSEGNQNLNSHDVALDPSCSQDKKENSFFYQAEDGQHIYMHNINVRMLQQEFGSLEHAFPIIKAKIVDIEHISMTEALRKRLRYLQHLPLTCEFQVVELNFSHLVSKPTIFQFKNEVSKRRHFRQKKAYDEWRREKYIEQEENKKLGKYPKATYNLQSNYQFPTYDPSDFQCLSPPKPDNALNDCSDENTMNMCAENSSFSANNCSSPPLSETIPTTSFAQMLKDVSKPFTQTPKEVEKPSLSEQPLQNHDLEAEESIAAPEYRQSFSDAIQAALDAVSIQDSPGNLNKHSKKKRGKKQLLFTTSMCRNK